MWWDILKNTSFTDKEYRHKIDGYNMFTLMFSDSKPSWMEVNTENHLPFTTLNQLIMNNDFQNKLNALFKFKKGSFAVRFDGVTVYVKLEEQENLHHFILEIDFINTTPRFEAYAKEEGLESKYKFEVNFIKEKNADEPKNDEVKDVSLVLEDFVDLDYYEGDGSFATKRGNARMEYFKEKLKDWKIHMGMPSKDELFRIYQKSILSVFHTTNTQLTQMSRDGKYYTDRFEIVYNKVMEGAE